MYYYHLPVNENRINAAKLVNRNIQIIEKQTHFEISLKFKLNAAKFISSNL